MNSNLGCSKTNKIFGGVLEALMIENRGGVIMTKTGKNTTGTDAVATVVTASSSDGRSDPDLGGKEYSKLKKEERRNKERREKRR